MCNLIVNYRKLLQNAIKRGLATSSSSAENSFQSSIKQEKKNDCHDLLVVYTDGACSANGTVHAKAGIGNCVFFKNKPSKKRRLCGF